MNKKKTLVEIRPLFSHCFRSGPPSLGHFLRSFVSLPSLPRSPAHFVSFLISSSSAQHPPRKSQTRLPPLSLHPQQNKRTGKFRMSSITSVPLFCFKRMSDARWNPKRGESEAAMKVVGMRCRIRSVSAGKQAKQSRSKARLVGVVKYVGCSDLQGSRSGKEEEV